MKLLNKLKWRYYRFMVWEAYNRSDINDMLKYAKKELEIVMKL